MIRFDYLHPARRAPLRVCCGTFAIDNRVRGPLLALFATLAVTAAAGMVQLERLHAAQHAYARAAAALIANEPAVRDAAALQERAARSARLSDDVDDVRRSGLQHANDLAWIGNRLPAQTWLHALRFEDGAYSLEGTSVRVSAVGAAMLALRDVDRATVPQLVSLQVDPTAGAAPIRYRLRITTSR